MLSAGVHIITNEQYHADPCVEPSISRGVICELINNTPAHARFYHPRLNPNQQEQKEDKFDIGTAAHALFLEGMDVAEVIDAPDWRGKPAKEARDAARETGKTPLLLHQYERVQAMVCAAHKQLAEWEEYPIKDLHGSGDSELTYIWQEDGIYCRVRPDWIRKDRKLILDYKTTGATANPAAFYSKMQNLGYDIQYEFYRRGVKAIEGISPRFRFMVQEDYEPYLCSFIDIDPQTEAIANQKVEHGLFMWRKCMETGRWPGYPLLTCTVETPAWAAAQWEIKAQNIGTEGNIYGQ